MVMTDGENKREENTKDQESQLAPPQTTGRSGYCTGFWWHTGYAWWGSTNTWEDMHSGHIEEGAGREEHS